MKVDSKDEQVFWNQVLARRDAIAAIDPLRIDAKGLLLEQLSSLDIQFDRAFDPADQFEAYVTLALCRAVRDLLAPQAKPS